MDPVRSPILPKSEFWGHISRRQALQQSRIYRRTIPSVNTEGHTTPSTGSAVRQRSTLQSPRNSDSTLVPDNSSRVYQWLPPAMTGARTATAVRTPFPRFSAVYAPFSQSPGLTLDRLRREGFLHVFSSWKRIATRARGLYRRGYPIPPPSNTRQPFRITLSRPSAFSIAFPRA